MFVFFKFSAALGLFVHILFCVDRTQNSNDGNRFLSEDQYTNNYYCQADSPSPITYEFPPNAKLLSLHLLTRHGDRSPIYLLPQENFVDSPWSCPLENSGFVINNKAQTKYLESSLKQCSDEDYCGVNDYEEKMWKGNCSLGQLTFKGADQLYNLGVNLREIYISKLKLIDLENENTDKYIYTRSTNYWRTKQSAASLLAGLLNKPYNGIIKVSDKLFETIAPYQTDCPLLRQIEQNITKSDSYTTMLSNFNKYELAFNRFLNGTLIAPELYSKIGAFLDVVGSRRCNGFQNLCDAEGKCIDDEIFNILMSFGNQETRLVYRDHFLNIPLGAKLRIGTLLLEVKRNILVEISKDTNFSYALVKKGHKLIRNAIKLQHKFYYYSGHDTSISSLLGAYSSFEIKWPPYASNFIWELLSLPQTNKDTSTSSQVLKNKYFIRIIYNGDVLDTTWCDNRPSQGFCSITSFLKYMDYTLGISGGFESYLNDEEVPLLAEWNQHRECHTQLL